MDITLHFMFSLVDLCTNSCRLGNTSNCTGNVCTYVALSQLDTQSQEGEGDACPYISRRQKKDQPLVHLADQVVDLVIPAAGLATVDVVQALLGHATQRGRQLKGPQEVGGLLEGWAARVDLVDEVLNADDVVLAQGLLNDSVVGERDPVLVDLAVAALVDQLTDGLEVGEAPGDVGLHIPQHVHGSLVDPHEDTVVDLAEAEQLQDLPGLGMHVVDTADANHEHDLSLRGHMEATLGLGLALQADEVILLGTVLSHIVLRALENLLALPLGGCGLSGSVRGLLGGPLLVALALLENSLGNGSHFS
mmetsp:Transcript_33672/g.95271  ORF Transcript_33672/g.95271 Transcript_33672/m.95271 type:complete len:306 (+) Transcript_33672:36-953(+)